MTNYSLKCPNCGKTDDCGEDTDEFNEPVVRCDNCGYSDDVGVFMGITTEKSKPKGGE